MKETPKYRILSFSNAGSMSENGRRRSGRKRTSTTMVIQGHTVLTKNNYVLKGLSYSYDAHSPDPRKRPKKKERETSSNKNKGISEKQKIRKKMLEERAIHNNHVKKRMAADQLQRHSFMKHNRKLLEPFVDPGFYTRVLSKGSTSNDSINEKQSLPSQPTCVTTVLRDYQFVGLEWMVDMHKKGMPMILGDEMGLVCSNSFHPCTFSRKLIPFI